MVLDMPVDHINNSRRVMLKNLRWVEEQVTYY